MRSQTFSVAFCRGCFQSTVPGSKGKMMILSVPGYLRFGIKGKGNEGGVMLSSVPEDSQHAVSGKDDMQYHASDAWHSQTLAQLADQHAQTAAQFSDVPPSNGGLSDGLKHKLAQDDLPDREVSQLINGYCRIREELELAGGPPPKNRIASSPGRRTLEASGSGGGVGNTEQLAISKTISALFDPMGPSSSDPILPQPADPEHFHEYHEPMFVRVFQNAENLTERRSLPPARRSPGPRSRDAGHSAEMAQMLQMLKAMSHGARGEIAGWQTPTGARSIPISSSEPVR